jgi:FlaA1/EpsC-like NDP-sugar epimerase
LHLRNRYLLGSDVVLFAASTFLAFLIRFEGMDWGPGQLRAAVIYGLLAVPMKAATAWAVGLYRRLWRYSGIVDLERILLACTASAAACFLLGVVLLPVAGLTSSRVPLSVLAIDCLLSTAAVALPRFGLRVFGRGVSRRPGTERARRALIVGAGTTGEIIVKELLRDRQLGLYPVGLVDDDRAKQGHRMCGVPVLGSLAKIQELVARHEIEEIVIAMPSAPGRVVREVVRAALDCGVKARTAPSMHDILSGRVAVASLRQVEIQDLLRRDPIQTDLRRVRSLAAGETVLVTGAGGSIGSELCRQLAGLEPARLLLLGHGENSIFDVLHELSERFPLVELVPIIADVRDRDRLRLIFEQYRPYAVFHAAAHKHVPLMELNVGEAVTNNVVGTRNVAELSADLGVEHLVLISTDKAVRPTNVMGATKRIAEQILQSVAEESGRNFVAVRFGNVLGSRGSVIPTFLRQIQSGGPVTVTHPEMRRYFMTIPEAVQLVLQAGALGSGGEVFVLDMGEPITILDLATDLIRLSGLEVGGDIEIQFTGARPGEKLYEELFFSSETANPTEHPKVLRAKNGALPAGLREVVDLLIQAAVTGAPDGELRGLLARLVPEFDRVTTSPSACGVHVPARSCPISRDLAEARPAGLARAVIGAAH